MNGGVRMALLAGVLVAVTACASDGDDTSAPTVAPSTSGPAPTAPLGETTTAGPGAGTPTTGVPAPVPDPDRGLHEDAVVVGGLATLSSATSPALADADVGARARFARANAEGGVNGRRIEMVEVVDDGGDPTQALAGARRLVEEDEVLAVVPVVSYTLTPEVRSLLTDAQVPFVGWGPDFCGSRYAFGITGCWPAATALDGHGLGEALASPAFVRAVAAALPADAPRTTAIVGDSGSLGQAAVDRTAELAAANGLQVVLTDATIPPTEPVGDYRPWAQRILAADAGRPPALVIHTGSIANVLGVSYRLRDAGYAGVQANPRTYDPVFALNHGLRYRIVDMLVGTPFTPIEVGDDPAVAQALDDLRTAGVETEGAGVATLLAGYWAADLFVALLEAAGPDPTAARLVAAADGWTYDGGGVGPSTWPAAHDEPVPCTNLVRVQPFVHENKVLSGRFDLVAPRSCVADTP